jgi:hypothetical protein
MHWRWPAAKFPAEQQDDDNENHEDFGEAQSSHNFLFPLSCFRLMIPLFFQLMRLAKFRRRSLPTPIQNDGIVGGQGMSWRPRASAAKAPLELLNHPANILGETHRQAHRENYE